MSNGKTQPPTVIAERYPSLLWYRRGRTCHAIRSGRTICGTFVPGSSSYVPLHLRSAAPRDGDARTCQHCINVLRAEERGRALARTAEEAAKAIVIGRVDGSRRKETER